MDHLPTNPSPAFTKAKLWSFVNLPAWGGVIAINALANTTRLNGVRTGEIADRFPNLFTPAGLTFSIWGLIYALLLAYIVYGAVHAFRKHEDVSVKINQISPWFLLTCVANVGWLLCWHYEQLGLSVLVMLALLGTLIAIYVLLRRAPAVSRKGNYFFLKLPFGVYLGWISIASMANITTLLVQAGWNRADLSEDFWLSALLLVAIGLTLFMALRNKDMEYTAVVIWALLGIIIKRTQANDTGLVGFYVAWTGIAVLAFALFYLVYYRWPKSGS